MQNTDQGVSNKAQDDKNKVISMSRLTICPKGHLSALSDMATRHFCAHGAMSLFRSFLIAQYRRPI